jgi:hypothetical protein
MPIDGQDREVVAELQRMLRELFDLALIGSAVHEPRLARRIVERCLGRDACVVHVEGAAMTVLAEGGVIAALLRFERDGVHEVGASRTKVAPSCDGHACAGPGRRREGWTAGAIARIAWRPVWLAPWERSRSTRGDVSHESPGATPLRKWVPTPMWALRAVYIGLFAP